MLSKKLFNTSFKIIIIVFAFTVLIIAGCEEDNPVKAVKVEGFGKELTINATGSTEWVYLSFAKGEVVTVTDPYNSTDWDLRVKRYHIGTNSGKGGAVDMGDVNFTAVIQAPAEGYVVDDSLSFESHSGVTKLSVNPTLETWAAMEGMPPTFVPSNHIFAVKTANGKYVKLWLKSYYNDEGTSGYVSLQYYYQADGSKNLNE